MESLATSRRDMLKQMAAFAAFGLGTTALSACGSESASGSDDLSGAALEATLRGSFLPTFDAITVDLAQRWEQDRNASIEVSLSEDWRAVTARVAEERQGADISELFGNEPHLISERLVDVSELAERLGEELGGWAEESRASCMVDGVWRAVPWSTTRHGLVVRTDLVAETGVGLPETYDDLLEIAVRLRELGAPPVGVTMSQVGPSDSAALAYGMLWSFGGQELSRDGRVALDSEGTRAALDYFAELSTVNIEGAFDFTHPDNNNAYLDGSLAITQNPSSIYLTALSVDATLAANTTNLPLPAGPAGRFQLPEINSLGVFRHSPDQMAAIDWIDFVTQRSVLVERASESLAFHAPLVLGLDDDEQMPWNQDERLTGYATSAAEGRVAGWPLAPSLEAGLVYENQTIINMFRSVGRGDMTVSAAIATATEDLRRVYET